MADNLQESGEFGPKLTSWAKEPTLLELKNDWEAMKSAHDLQIGKINGWTDLLHVKGTAKLPKIRGRSNVQPKLVRKQAEWRYPALSEPFLGTDKLFKGKPRTREDVKSARQNELLLNYQFSTQINKVSFIDNYVRATVDEGTSIVRVGWNRATKKIKTEVPIYEHLPIEDEEGLNLFKQAIAQRLDDPRSFKESAPPELIAALDYYDESGEPNVATDSGRVEEVPIEKILENRPTVEVMNPHNVFIDPSCNGDIDKAMFIGVTFETSKAELLKAGKRYKNLNKVIWDANTVLSQPDHVSQTPENFNLNNSLTKKVVAYEYWGYYDIHGDDCLYPVVITWIGNVVVRMEENPFPDEKLPFVVVPYMPILRGVYGEPDAELLGDNQRVQGAITRGIIDIMGRSANGQQGVAKGMLDPLNKRRFDEGKDYEYNPNISPNGGLIEHKYPEIPQTALIMANRQSEEAEALTGVKSFSGGLTGESYGDMAAGARGAMDASAKREMSILRRLVMGLSLIGSKISAMNSAFLSEEEVVRITNDEFVVIKREDLKGNFDMICDLNTAEVENAQANDMAFMVQTIGPNEDPEMRRLLLADIARLKRMPELEHKIRTFQPTPDPVAEKIKELQVKELELKIQKLQSEIDLNVAKAAKTEAEADQANLDFVEQETGTEHARNMEMTRGQAQGNIDLELTKAIVKPKKENERDGDIEAGIGFSKLANKSDNDGNVGATPLPVAPPMMPELPIEPEMAVDPMAMPFDPAMAEPDPMMDA